MIVDGELAASWHSAAACCVMLVRSQTNDTEEQYSTVQYSTVQYSTVLCDVGEIADK